MDTNTHFYYLVYGFRSTSTDKVYILEGFDFHGGLSSQTVKLLKPCLFVVNENGVRTVNELVGVVHRARRGFELEWSGNAITNLPCLFTTDPTVKWMYLETVHISVLDPKFDFSESLEFGLPLVGENWVGVARQFGNCIRLEAFASRELNFSDSIDAYCPHWAQSIADADDLIFTVQKATEVIR